MFIPGLISLMVRIYRSYKDRERYSWREWAVECAVITPLYPLYVIMWSIHTAVRTLLGTVTEGNIEDTKQFKLIEIIGERQCFTENIEILKYQLFNTSSFFRRIPASSSSEVMK